MNLTDSELYCLRDAMVIYRETHSKYTDEEGIAEMDSVLAKLKELVDFRHGMFNAMAMLEGLRDKNRKNLDALDGIK